MPEVWGPTNLLLHHLKLHSPPLLSLFSFLLCILFLLDDEISLPLLAALVVVVKVPRLREASGEGRFALATDEPVEGGPLQVPGLAGWLLEPLSLLRLPLAAIST